MAENAILRNDAEALIDEQVSNEIIQGDKYGHRPTPS
jgi:hypothetical protein